MEPNAPFEPISLGAPVDTIGPIVRITRTARIVSLFTILPHSFVMTTPLISSTVTHAVAAALPSKIPAPAWNVNGADAARFEQALASAPSLPEHHLFSAAGKLAGNTEHLVQRVALDERTLDDPTHMVAAQREITERVLALEFVAKTAGAVTQGVNKLVHMQ
ncbi:type III secretion system inner rod subunit SctI [Pandoraea sp. ISTKB]|uniref:type III secretion system inner rod subunit SctI n=1 Tax=Pandoraea sp. ISTKB TaxID=1586708 RepID=UPI001F0B5B1D|nr:type III secretion system inner rod subunit SctI [Pandoraea sp. ISTKB]